MDGFFVQHVCFSKKTGGGEEPYNVVMHVHVNPEQPKTARTKAANQDKKDSICSCTIFWRLEGWGKNSNYKKNSSLWEFIILSEDSLWYESES